MRRLRRLIPVVGLALLLGAPTAGRAEMYRYTDEKGDTYIVQSLDDVPERYRKFAKPLADPLAAATHPMCLAASDAPPGGAKIRFKPHFYGRIYVQACVNGKGPVPLILDTGAEVTMIDDAVLQGFGVDLRDAPAIGLAGIGRGVRAARIAKIESLQVEGARVGPLFITAAKFDLPEEVRGVGVVGLLGQDFLKDFFVDIDYQRGIAVLAPRSKPGGAKAQPKAGGPAPKKNP